MSVIDEARLARAALTYLAEPGDLILGALLEAYEPGEVLAAINAGALPAGALPLAAAGGEDASRRRDAVLRALGRWRLRLQDVPGLDSIRAACTGSMRLACPGDPEWPGALDELGIARPYALWLRGAADLGLGCLRSVSMVGSRAATGYGAHVAREIAADLAERGWMVVSGGAYGIDAAVHRGALVTGGTTVAVLACGVDHPYPVGHADLFAAIADNGLIASEWPPGSRPTRVRFLVRNRVIAALTCGTVIVEAGERSGALNTARHAAELHRPLMAIPGPVTSPQSAGCHRIVREWAATLVTSAGDVAEMLSQLGSSVPGSGSGSVALAGPAVGAEAAGSEPAGARRPGVPRTRDDLDLDCARVLDAFPVRSGIGPSTIASRAGVELSTVARCIGLLAGCGFIEPCDQGWRLSRKAR